MTDYIVVLMICRDYDLFATKTFVGLVKEKKKKCRSIISGHKRNLIEAPMLVCVGKCL